MKYAHLSEFVRNCAHMKKRGMRAEWPNRNSKSVSWKKLTEDYCDTFAGAAFEAVLLSINRFASDCKAWANIQSRQLSPKPFSNDGILFSINLLQSESWICLRLARAGVSVESVERLGLDTRPIGSVIVQSFDDQPLRVLAGSELADMEEGKRQRPDYMAEVRAWTEEIVERVRGFQYETLYAGTEPLGRCPACGTPVREMLRYFQRDRNWVLHDREPVTNWTRGRATLLGDAAHPTLQYLAQGANMAIEDAVVLAAYAEITGCDWEMTFKLYEDARYKRTARVQIMSRYYGDAYHAAGVVRELRNDILAPKPGAAPDFEGVAWLYNGITVPGG